jgi:hypothetical protein
MELSTDLEGVSYDPATDRFKLPLVLSGSYYRAMIGAGAPLMGTVQLRQIAGVNTLVLKAVDGEAEEPAPRLPEPAPRLPENQPGIAEEPENPPGAASTEAPKQEPQPPEEAKPVTPDAVPAVGMDAVPVPQAYMQEDDGLEAVPTGESVRDRMPQQADWRSQMATGIVAATDVGMPGPQKQS